MAEQRTAKIKAGRAGTLVQPKPKEVPKWSKKIRRTRRQIAEAAVTLFEAKGFSATTVEEIMKAADYSYSSFFRLFGDKEEVVFYDFPERLDDLKAVFASPHHGSPWQAVRTAFIEYARLWDADESDLGIRRARLFHSEPVLYARYLLKNAEWENAIANLVLSELKGSERNRDLLCRVIAGAASTAFRAAWRTKLLSKKKQTLSSYVEEAFSDLEQMELAFR